MPKNFKTRHVSTYLIICKINTNTRNIFYILQKRIFISKKATRQKIISAGSVFFKHGNGFDRFLYFYFVNFSKPNSSLLKFFKSSFLSNRNKGTNHFVEPKFKQRLKIAKTRQVNKSLSWILWIYLIIMAY